jgi:hypothetical protein
MLEMENYADDGLRGKRDGGASSGLRQRRRAQVQDVSYSPGERMPLEEGLSLVGKGDAEVLGGDVDVGRLRDALKLVLLLHKDGWNAETDRPEWDRITGGRSVSSETLRDHVEHVLEQTNYEVKP